MSVVASGHAAGRGAPRCYGQRAMRCCVTRGWRARQAAPIVRVAIEPADPSQMAALAAGLRLLNRADPFVEVTVQESGEHVVGAAGARARPHDACKQWQNSSSLFLLLLHHVYHTVMPVR